MFCKKCGSVFPDGAGFCGTCGAPVDTPAAPPVSAPVKFVPPVAPPQFPPPQGYGAPVMPPSQPPRKSQGLMWGIIAAALIVVLGGGGTAAFLLTRGDDGSAVITSAGASASQATVTVPATSQATVSSDTTELTTTTAETTDERSGGTLSVSTGEPACIDPVNVVTLDDLLVADALFDGLTKYDYATEELLPAAAESWSANADATVWTFKLRAGAKFSDGTPVTAADFKYAWERVCNPANESGAAYHLAPVKGYDEMQNGTTTELAGVKAVDDLTLEVTLNYAFGDFEYVVGRSALAPVPKAAVEKNAAGFAQMPVGNGPFKMSEPWAHDQYVKVVRNENYYGQAPHVDGVDFMIMADEATAWLEFKAGNLDFDKSVPSEALAEAVATYGESADGLTVSPGEQFLGGPEVSVYYMLLNNKNGTLKNPALRQALSLAIDRQAISDAVYGGVRWPATSIIPDGIAGYQEGAWQYSTYDVEAAKAKLADAGYPEGKGLPEIVISFNTGSGHENVMSLVSADWAKIGVTAKLDGQDWTQYLDKLQAGEYMSGRLGWIANYPSIDDFLYPLFTPGGDDMSFYEDPAVTAALQDARKTVNTNERIAKYQAIVKTIGDASPVIPIVIYRHHAIGSDRVHDLVYSSLGLLSLDTAWLSSE
jgi:oligopeptide transport system substrate-binding protein